MKRYKSRHRWKCIKAISLIEVLVVMLISSSFFLATAAVFVVGHRNWQMNWTLIGLHDDLSDALRSMVRELREAGVISPLGIQVFNSGRAISFEIPDTVNSQGPVTWRAVQYSLGGSDDDQLIRTDTNGNRILATKVSNLNFIYNPPRVVEISMTGTRVASDGRTLSQTVSAEVTARNCGPMQSCDH